MSSVMRDPVIMLQAPALGLKHGLARVCVQEYVLLLIFTVSDNA